MFTIAGGSEFDDKISSQDVHSVPKDLVMVVLPLPDRPYYLLNSPTFVSPVTYHLHRRDSSCNR